MIMASRTDDADGVEELMASCRGIVVKLAKRYHRPLHTWITMDELIHEATVSVWKAAKKWQELQERKGRFSSYAWDWIRHDLYLYVCQTAGTIYVPRQGNWRRRAEVMVHTVSLDEALNDSGFTRHEFIAQETAESLYDSDEHELMKRGLELLDARDRWILTEYYFKGRTLRNMGEERGTAHQAVNQLRAKALKRLKLRVGELQRQRQIQQKGQARA